VGLAAGGSEVAVEGSAVCANARKLTNNNAQARPMVIRGPAPLFTHYSLFNSLGEGDSRLLIKQLAAIPGRQNDRFQQK
jgi:hypothetical protein